MKTLLLARSPRYFFMNDIGQEFERQGVGFEFLATHDPDQVSERIDRFNPDFVFCIGVLPELSASVAGRRPIVYYELDKMMSSDIFKITKLGTADIVFSAYKDDLELFRRAGAAECHYLPFFPNIRRHQQKTHQYKRDVCFVGSSIGETDNDYQWYVNKVREVTRGKQEIEHQFERLVELFDQLIKLQEEAIFSNRYVLPDLCEQHLSGEVEHLLRFFKLPPKRALNILAKDVASRQRAGWLRLIPNLSVFGDPGWKGLLGDGCVYQGSIDQYFQSSAVFFENKINLNIQRLYALGGLSDRVFNVLYSEGFLISDRNDAIEELFVDREELVLFSSPEELKEMTHYYLGHDREREAIAKNGYNAVLRGHLLSHRVARILAEIGPRM